MNEKSLYKVQFTDERFAPVLLPRDANLSEHLSVCDSPMLFGCRTGLCGTCLIRVEAIENGTLHPPDADELEVLELAKHLGDGLRLACQVRLTADIKLTVVDF